MSELLTRYCKQLVNSFVSPYWCSECGVRLLEEEIGFRESGSYYQCDNIACTKFGRAFRLPLPRRTITGRLRALEPMIDF